jgi:menaquinol-cytochrome c reductase iron-sulfur subunit
LGCAVEFDPANKQFECPCHKSGFAIDGKQLFGPSRRGLDPLPVKLEDKAGAKEILVKFERFKGGIPERKLIE